MANTSTRIAAFWSEDGIGSIILFTPFHYEGLFTIEIEFFEKPYSAPTATTNFVGKFRFIVRHPKLVDSKFRDLKAVKTFSKMQTGFGIHGIETKYGTDPFISLN